MQDDREYFGPVLLDGDDVRLLQETAYSQLQEICQLRAQITALEQRTGFNREFKNLQDTIVKIGNENRKHKRQYPDLHKIPLARIIKLIPKGMISPQAVYKWCEAGVVDAEHIGGRWRVVQASFEAVWAARGFPPLPL